VISGARRFLHYKVQAKQTVHGTTSPASSWQGVAPAGSAGAASAAEGRGRRLRQVQTEGEGKERDPSVPRRPGDITSHRREAIWNTIAPIKPLQHPLPEGRTSE
jgi:hypothetical protein